MYDYKFKLVLLGSPSVGKTSLMLRFVNNLFDEDYASTIGAKFLSKEVSLKDTQVLLSIWDIAGQPRFRDLRTTFYRGSNGALFVFDLTRKHTLEELDGWYTEMTKVLPKDLSIILIGNKADLEEREVELEDAKQFLKEKNAVYLETSAKTGDHVEEAFLDLTYKMAGLELPKETLTVKDNGKSETSSSLIDTESLNEKKKQKDKKIKKKRRLFFWRR